MTSPQNKTVTLIDLGQQRYAPVWAMQEEQLQAIVAQKRANRTAAVPQPTPNYLYWVEHPPVITLGKSGDENNLLLNREKLAQKGIDFVVTNRGGDITFHGPGQLVGYPILDLDNFFTDIHRYLRLLEETIILTLADFGLKGERSPGETGVWLGVGTPFPRKICAMGVKASRWVTMHGFAFNVTTDMSYFDYIVPCGIQGKAVTSLAQELETVPSMDVVKARVAAHFQQLFSAELVSP